MFEVEGPLRVPAWECRDTKVDDLHQGFLRGVRGSLGVGVQLPDLGFRCETLLGQT